MGAASTQNTYEFYVWAIPTIFQCYQYFRSFYSSLCFCIAFKNWNEIILNISGKRANVSIEFLVVSILLTKRTPVNIFMYKVMWKAFIETKLWMPTAQSCQSYQLHEINILVDRQYQRRQLYLTTWKNHFYSNIRYKYKTDTIMLAWRLTECLH